MENITHNFSKPLIPSYIWRLEKSWRAITSFSSWEFIRDCWEADRVRARAGTNPENTSTPPLLTQAYLYKSQLSPEKIWRPLSLRGNFGKCDLSLCFKVIFQLLKTLKIHWWDNLPIFFLKQMQSPLSLTIQSAWLTRVRTVEGLLSPQRLFLSPISLSFSIYGIVEF